ncbi:MAG: PaaI family thioesterase [Hyphomicrobiales bacterium]|nr:PaaI family thioesterase [Hyphomicrobiales bacterium]
MNVGVVPLETLKSHDGASFLTKIMEGELPLPPIMDALGFHPHVVEEGRVVFTGMPEHRHYNPIGSVHAGFALTLLDSCVACAVHSSCKRGEGYTTLELKSNFVRPLTEKTGPVFADGRVVFRGRRTATAEGTLKDETGKLYAHASTTCLIFDL